MGWNEDLVGLADVGGVGYTCEDGVLELVATAGCLEVDAARVKPSSLGSGAVKGSSMYLEA